MTLLACERRLPDGHCSGEEDQGADHQAESWTLTKLVGFLPIRMRSHGQMDYMRYMAYAGTKTQNEKTSRRKMPVISDQAANRRSLPLAHDRQITK
jgi:hypothetical protein